MTAARVVILTVLLVVVGAALVKGTSDSGDKNPVASVDNGAPRGLLALRLLLEARGRVVHVRRTPHDAAPPPRATVIVPPPEAASIDEPEADALLGHAERGGTVIVLCDDDEPRTRRLDRLLARADAACFVADVPLGDIAQTRSTAALPGFARELSVRGLGRARPRPGGSALPVLAVGADPFALVRAVGDGRVFVLGSATPFANDGLAQGDNARWLLDLTAGTPVVVDERLHRGRGADVLALARRAGVGPAVLLLGVFALLPLSLLSLAPRRGDLPRRALDRGPPAAARQAEALASLLALARRPSARHPTARRAER